MGHTVFNWALRYVQASIISGTILAEPVVAALLAWIVLSERPGLPTIVGGAVVLAGLYFLLKGRSAAGEPDRRGILDHRASPGDAVSSCMYGYPESVSGPIRTGYFYRLAGVLVALASDLYFLFVDPSVTPGWVLAAIAQYRTRLALALFLFLAILAALRVRPTRLDPGRALQVAAGTRRRLAATVVAVMVGITLFLTTALQATLFAGTARDYAREAAPKSSPT